MLKYLKQFSKDETGAVTVEYVALVAGAVALSFAAMTALQGSTGGLADSVASLMINWFD